MKKYFYLAAVSAMMLTACSSDKDVLEPTPKPSTPTVAAQQQAVAFDTYLAGTTASTRAGDPTGVMTTDKLKTLGKGFGVFAFHQQGATYAAAAPNFMYNEHVSWNSGWIYSPLKYWPNETTNDSQTPSAASTGAPNNDYLSFFAYAPYVNPDATTTGVMTVDRTVTPATTKDASVFATAETEGIISLSANTLSNDPLVEWGYSANPDKNVDLLWGVAPAGFSYTNVNGSTTSVGVGLPLKDLVKPDKDQKVKFLFQHALSRIGLSVVSAIDQIAAGDDAGTFSKDPTTKVLIKEVNIYGDFGKQGVLNLNNTNSNEAKWITESLDKSSVTGSALFSITGSGTGGNYYLAPDLRYVQGQIDKVTGTTGTPPITADPDKFADINTGVLPSEQALLAGDKDDSKKVTDPTFAYGKVYYTSADASDASELGYVVAKITTTAPAALFTKDEDGNYIQAFANGASVTLNGYSPEYYSLTLSTPIAKTAALPAGNYYVKSGTGSNIKYTLTTLATAGTSDADDKWYPTTGFSDAIQFVGTPGTAYATGTYYTGLIPRYFMVIPTGSTKIKVNIVYAVVTKDEKLDGNVSNVENNITKEVTVDLKNGKSYNLKLILGLTSVKLDATVADWKLADETEVYLPQNSGN